MATVYTRQPLGALEGGRLKQLSSVKNCQNAITASLASQNTKQPFASPGKRSISATLFDECEDAENIHPSALNSPSKRAKNIDGTPVKPSNKFILQDKLGPASSSTRPVLSPRKPLSVSVPNTTTTTPISASRGSPKHKRIGLLTKGRRASSSPFRRIDPPTSSAGGLPFSIDEALKGTISGYMPKGPAKESTTEKPLPKGWFFEIHCDSFEEEAANLMEHSASVLDISSDDDAATRQQNELREKGKENIPPAEHLTNLSAAAGAAAPNAANATAPAHQSKAKRARACLDAMVEDRKALGELPAHEYYADGLTASSNVVVRGDDVISPQRSSGLSKEFDFSVAAVPSPQARLTAAKTGKAELGQVDVNAQSKEIFVLAEDDEVL